LASGLRDELARKRIVDDLDTCILIEAGAGSGKTFSLVARMVALIGSGKCRAETMAAITFTRKAAQELKGRFQVEMERAFAGETDGVRRKRLGRGLEELDRCFLGTVHSFCTAILRERPIEAGLDPGFEELDELEDALLLDRAWDEYLARLQASRPELLEELQPLGAEAPDLIDCYRELSTYPDVDVARDDASRPDLTAARQRFYDLLDWAEGVLPNQAPRSGWDGLQGLLRTALQRRPIYNLDDDIILLRFLADIDRSGNITLNRWDSEADARQAKERFEAFRTGYLAPALRQWREYRHARLMEFILPAIERYGELKREKSRLNFQDLLMNTASLLRQNPEVRSYFQGRYTHLLVDEFQDTDPIQAEIMFYLTGQEQNGQEQDGEGVTWQDWRELRPRPGSLFVVGDPKQSIYRFRRADIDTYNEVKRLIIAGGGAVLRLTTNFRSLDALGAWANPAFRALLPVEADRFQAAFEGLDTVRTADGGCYCGIRAISIPRVDRHRAEEIARLDAGRIAAWISRALAGGIRLSRTDGERAAGLTEQPRPGDFLILMRYKANIDIYAAALENCGIPYRIAGGEGFSRSPELLDLLKLLCSLLDPGDLVKLVAVLRSGLFGISDSQLYRFSKAGGHFDMRSEAPEQLEAGDRKLFDWAFAELRQFRDWLQGLPASAALEAIVSALGSVPAALTGELGRGRAGRLVQCLELLADAERKGTTSPAGQVEYLASLMQAGVRVTSAAPRPEGTRHPGLRPARTENAVHGRGAGIEEEIDLTPWDNDYVRIMNLHKAKGLEAAVVFLANPAKNRPHTPTVHISRRVPDLTGAVPGVGTAPRGYFVIEKMRGYAREVLGQPLDWDAHCETEQRYQDAEERRLLYVAATRARDLLVVSRYQGKPEISPWSPFEDHLDDVSELDVAGASGPDIARPAELDIACTSEPCAGAGSGGAGGGGGIELTPGDFEQVREDIRAARSAIGAASYTHTPVTSLVKAGQPAPPREDTGRGQSWGNVIHRLLDACARGRAGDIEALARRVLVEEGRPPGEAALAVREARDVLGSPLWKRAMGGGQYFMEAPFYINTGGDAAEGDRAVKGAGDSIVSGTIDLVFKEGDGWVIVDFKTDTVGDEIMLNGLTEYYTPQLEMYRRAWESVVGEPVREMCLYFTAINKLVKA
jgi:ATP-dependent helicase/nuclease subunit A